MSYFEQRIEALRAVIRYTRFRDQLRQFAENRRWEAPEVPTAQRRCSKYLDNIVDGIKYAYRIKDREIREVIGFR